jgi:hypothetical protein
MVEFLRKKHLSGGEPSFNYRANYQNGVEINAGDVVLHTGFMIEFANRALLFQDSSDED